jgi:putative ABC transport system permease protein
MRDVVRRIDSGIAMADVRIMGEVTDDSFSTPRFALFLVTLFAGLALTLAATGVHGVISYIVGQRMHEFGMRMALGARRSQILRLVLVQGIRMASVGVAAGLIISAALSRVLSTLLYEVEHLDALTFVGVGMLAMAVTILACYVPARRATAADPMQALRTE